MTEYISSNFDSTQVHLPVLQSWTCEIDASGNTLYLTSSGGHGLPRVDGFHFQSSQPIEVEVEIEKLKKIGRASCRERV